MDDIEVRTPHLSTDASRRRCLAVKVLRAALVVSAVFITTPNCSFGDPFAFVDASVGTGGTSNIGKDASTDARFDALGGSGGEDGSNRDGAGGGGGNSGGNGGTSTGGAGAGGAPDDGGDVGTGGVGGRGGAGGRDGAADATPPDGSSGSSGTGGASGNGGTGGSSGNAGTGGSGGAAGIAGTGGSGGGTIDVNLDAISTSPVFSVGSFAKSSDAGTQVIMHGLGSQPKAILLWTSGKTNETASSGFYFGMGVSDGDTSRSMSASVRDAAGPSTSGRRLAAKAIVLSNFDEVVVAEADMTSWSATTFSLSWTTNNSEPYVIHYLVIGGPSVTARVVAWQAPTAAGTRAVSVGFRPDAVLHFHLGASFESSPPSSNGNAIFGMGAMDSAGAQWALMAGDSSGATPTTSSRAQKTDSVVYMSTDSGGATLTKEAKFASMDNSGFTLNFTSNSSSNQTSQLFSLALTGVKAKAGFFAKSTAAQPAPQSITSPGFRPGAVLLASYQSVAQTAAVHAPELRYGLGASDGSHEASTAITAANGAMVSSVNGVDRIGKAFVKVDNVNMSVDAEADLTSLDPTGFTLNWTKNDAIATQICFLALGAP